MRISVDGGKTWNPVETTLPAQEGGMPPKPAWFKPPAEPGTGPMGPQPTAAQQSKSDAIIAKAGRLHSDSGPLPHGARGGRGMDAPLDANRPRMGGWDAAGNAAQEGAGLGFGSYAAGLGSMMGGPEVARAGQGMEGQPVESSAFEQFAEGRDADREQVSRAFEDRPEVAYTTAFLAGLPLAIATAGQSEGATGATLASRMASGAVAGGKAGAKIGLATGAGHIDPEPGASGGENTTESMKALATHTGLGALGGFALGGLMEAPITLARAGGKAIWDRRISRDNAVAAADDAGAQPAVFSAGALEPGPRLKPLVSRRDEYGSTPEGIAEHEMNQAIDEALMARANPSGEAMPFEGLSPTNIEATNLASRIRNAKTDKTLASMARGKGEAELAGKLDTEMAPSAPVDEAADAVVAKFTQKGGRAPSDEDVVDSGLKATEAMDAEGEAAGIKQRVDELMKMVREIDARSAKRRPEAGAFEGLDDDLALAKHLDEASVLGDKKAEFEKAAAGLRKESEDLASVGDAELMFAPTALAKQIKRERPDMLDATKLQEQINLIQARRKAAQAAKSPDQQALLEIEAAYKELQNEYHPNMAGAVERTGKRAEVGEAESQSLGLGNKETFTKEVSFGEGIDAIVNNLVAKPALDADRALKSVIKDAADRADFVEAINHVRNTARLEKEARLLDRTPVGGKARAELGPKAVEAGRMAKGVRGFREANVENAPVGFFGLNTAIRGVWNRLAALKKLPNQSAASVGAGVANLPYMEEYPKEARQ
jgi:hypothetical protein